MQKSISKFPAEIYFNFCQLTSIIPLQSICIALCIFCILFNYKYLYNSILQLVLSVSVLTEAKAKVVKIKEKMDTNTNRIQKIRVRDPGLFIDENDNSVPQPQISTNFGISISSTSSESESSVLWAVASASNPGQKISRRRRESKKVRTKSEDFKQEIENQTKSDKKGWISWLQWSQPTDELLFEIENDILCKIKSRYKIRYINIGKVVGDQDNLISTLSINEHLAKTQIPLVLCHGLASGKGLWALNLDGLSEDRALFAFDLLGFARSSRPNFSSTPDQAEQEWVQTIEEWRKKMGFEKIDLVGHSLGGYLSFSYALSYPERISHLFLVDPWGFNDIPNGIQDMVRVPLVRRIAAKVLEPFNPLIVPRILGKYLGQKLLEFIRKDLITRFEDLLNNDAKDKIGRYIYTCNARSPTGESAFHAMMQMFGWSKNAMHKRIYLLDDNVNLTVIYGSKSWVDHYPIEKFRELRRETCFEGHILEGTHHVYADQVEEFNKIVKSVCAFSNNNL